MRSAKGLLIAVGTFAGVLALALMPGCGSSSSGPTLTFPAGLKNGPTIATVTGPNVMQLTVDGSNCAGTSQDYYNKPCVSVTVCDTTGNNCQVISDLLLDTGSVGLRVFKSVLSAGLQAALTPITVGGQSLTECVQFGDGSLDWGTVDKAQVILGSEAAVTVPIQVIDSTFMGEATHCPNADTSPNTAGFNGILGMGINAQDCGATCTTQANNGNYYLCSGGTCAGSMASLANQLTHPGSALPLDNNGEIVRLPSVAFGGQASASGYLILGIGTRSNNTPSGVTAVPTNSAGDFTTTFGGRSYAGSFLDTGSNAFFFARPTSESSALPFCSGGTFYCPTSNPPIEFSASDLSYGGAVQANVTFYVGNMTTMGANPSNRVFTELGGDISASAFDWGLPFYFGRDVYVGLSGTTSSLGVGPYWAF